MLFCRDLQMFTLSCVPAPLDSGMKNKDPTEGITWDIGKTRENSCCGKCARKKLLQSVGMYTLQQFRN